MNGIIRLLCVIMGFILICGSIYGCAYQAKTDSGEKAFGFGIVLGAILLIGGASSGGFTSDNSDE